MATFYWNILHKYGEKADVPEAEWIASESNMKFARSDKLSVSRILKKLHKQISVHSLFIEINKLNIFE